LPENWKEKSAKGKWPREGKKRKGKTPLWGYGVKRRAVGSFWGKVPGERKTTPLRKIGWGIEEQ